MRDQRARLASNVNELGLEEPFLGEAYQALEKDEPEYLIDLRRITKECWPPSHKLVMKVERAFPEESGQPPLKLRKNRNRTA